MSLTNQTIDRIRLILDKPATPLTFRQITQLVNKQTAPIQQLATLFISKHRADLIIFVLQKYVVTAECMEAIIASACKDLLKYSLQDLKSIWKLILEKEVAKVWRQKWGTQRIMQDAFKITNQSQKEVLFELLASNVTTLLQLNEVKIVEEFVKKYAASFIKYNIYLAPVPALVSQCLMINSRAQIKLLDSSLKKTLLQRTISLLNATSQRKIYSYQNNCMSLITLLLRDPGQCFADLLDIYECQKVLKLYLWNKPTREDARKMQQAVQVTRQRIENEQKNKMDYRSQIIREKQPIKTPLIQNIIDRTNCYREKQMIGIARQNQEVSPSRPKSSNFLKKGLGNGGGKAQISTYKSPQRKLKMSSIDQIVESCFTQKESELNLGSSKSNKTNSAQKFLMNNLREKASRESQNDTVSMYASSIQDGEQWAEISNLIDLAYQYKFG